MAAGSFPAPNTEATCDGDGRGEGHCCVIAGEECPALVLVAGTPRCPFMVAGTPMLGNPEWERLPVGRFFASTHPGFDCADWPQAIPDVMERGVGLCCWKGE